jgi:hypothetical protein
MSGVIVHTDRDTGYVTVYGPFPDQATAAGYVEQFIRRHRNDGVMFVAETVAPTQERLDWLAEHDRRVAESVLDDNWNEYSRWLAATPKPERHTLP